MIFSRFINEILLKVVLNTITPNPVPLNNYYRLHQNFKLRLNLNLFDLLFS